MERNCKNGSRLIFVKKSQIYIMNTQNNNLTFITLNNRVFAEYYIDFKVNIIYNLNKLQDIKSKQNIFFDKFKYKNQHLNLTYVDTLFSNIFIDLVTLVLTENISNINQYFSSKNKSIILKGYSQKKYLQYLEYKFFNFLDLMLYSDISKNRVFDEKNHPNRVFCTKLKDEQIQYFTVFDKKELFLLLFEKLKLELDYEKSTMVNNKAKVCIKLVFYP